MNERTINPLELHWAEAPTQLHNTKYVKCSTIKMQMNFERDKIVNLNSFPVTLRSTFHSF